MAKIFAPLRNQHTSLDAVPARKRNLGPCAAGCGALIHKHGKKEYCDPCADKLRHEYMRAFKARRYRERKANA